MPAPHRTALFLRAVNVGGTGKLPMADLRVALAGAGCTDVATYIQSGNAVMTLPPLGEAAVLRALGALSLPPDSPLLVPAQRLRALRSACPWPNAPPGSVHVFLRRAAFAPDLDRLLPLALPDEALADTPDALWLLAPGGIGRSKLAAALGRTGKTALTARNLRTLDAVIGML